MENDCFKPADSLHASIAFTANHVSTCPCGPSAACFSSLSSARAASLVWRTHVHVHVRAGASIRTMALLLAAAPRRMRRFLCSSLWSAAPLPCTVCCDGLAMFFFSHFFLCDEMKIYFIRKSWWGEHCYGADATCMRGATRLLGTTKPETQSYKVVRCWCKQDARRYKPNEWRRSTMLQTRATLQDWSVLLQAR